MNKLDRQTQAQQAVTHTYQRGLVEIVVHRPILDDKERQKREETVLRAMSTFGKEAMRQRIATAQ
jgi:hypothetical protein